MCIKKIAIEKILLDDDFDYQELYNDNRGGVFKEEFKYLVRDGISKGFITVEKYVIAKSIQEKLLDIIKAKDVERNLLKRLKDYHNEPEEVAASIVYTLRKLDSNFTVTTSEGKVKIVSDLFEVEICPRIGERNAEPRIFLPKEKIAVISTNENITNLADILAVRDVTVYAIDVDYWDDTMYAYRIIRDDHYFDMADKFMNNVRSDQANEYRKYMR